MIASYGWTSMSELWTRVGGLAAAGLKARRRRAAIEATLAGMEDRQLDDLGIRRGEIRAYAAAAPLAPGLVVQMLAARRPDVKWRRLRPMDRDRLLTECRVCPSATACRRWFTGRAGPGGAFFFCPNAALMDRLSTPGGEVCDHGAPSGRLQRGL